MLTPKHRALFAAAYSTLLLRTSREDEDHSPAASAPEDGHNINSDNQEAGATHPADPAAGEGFH
jgi:hypothetical protein